MATRISIAGMALVAGFLPAACADMATSHPSGNVDTRESVEFPEPLRSHTLANMRDHLETLRLLQDDLARGSFSQAAETAESRLGLSSLELHGAHEVAGYMPAAMQAMGLEMHNAASRFAIDAADAGATGDNRKALASLADLTARCVACHAAYKLR